MNGNGNGHRWPFDPYCQLKSTIFTPHEHSSLYIGLNFRHFPIAGRKECGQMGNHITHVDLINSNFRSISMLSFFVGRSSVPLHSLPIPSNIISSIKHRNHSDRNQCPATFEMPMSRARSPFADRPPQPPPCWRPREKMNHRKAHQTSSTIFRVPFNRFYACPQALHTPAHGHGGAARTHRIALPSLLHTIYID